jgi:hypothetical protein
MNKTMINNDSGGEWLAQSKMNPPTKFASSFSVADGTN